MKENEIRKRDVYDKYLRLVQGYIEKNFDFSAFIHVACPACASDDYRLEFEKNKFKLVTCKACSTLYVNPRPSLEKLKELYSGSEAEDVWVKEFFIPVAQVRKEKIFRPRAEYISKFLKDKDTQIIGDIGAGFGLFLEELRQFLPKARYIAIEPSVRAARLCREKGFNTECQAIEEISGFESKFGLLTAFELIDHLFDPSQFLKKVHSLLKPGGYFLCTTVNSQGLDFLLLWDKAKTVAPPLHMNYFNPRSFAALFEKSGFEVVEISTPGKLDWDIVEGMIKEEGVKMDRFWEFLAYSGSKESKDELQDWITRNNYSSHMRILAKKLL